MQEDVSLVSPEGGVPAPPRPELRLLRGDEVVGVYWPLDQGLIIGKAPTSHVVVEGMYVSKTHAQIVRLRGRWIVEDMGSTNGTFVYERDQLVYSSALDALPWPLQDRQEIRLGPHPTEWRLLFLDPTMTAKSPSIYIDEKQRQVWVRGHLLKLPRDHYTVLLQLYKATPAPCSYDALCAAIEQDRQTREKITSVLLVPPSLVSLHQLIHRLRARVELDPKQPTLIIQSSQFGYRLRNER